MDCSNENTSLHKSNQEVNVVNLEKRKKIR